MFQSHEPERAFNSHVEGHVIGGAILVVIRYVMDGAYCHDDLAQRVNDGQVNDRPVQREEEEDGAKSKWVCVRFR